MLERLKKKLGRRQTNHVARNASIAATGVVMGSSLIYYLIRRKK